MNLVIDWGAVLPIWLTQVWWVFVLVMVHVYVTRKLLKIEGDKVTAALLPLLKRAEQMGFVSAEQASMTAQDIRKVMTKQGEATEQVDQVPGLTADLTADKVVGKLPPQVAKSTTAEPSRPQG